MSFHNIVAVSCVMATTVAIIVVFVTPNWLHFISNINSSGLCKAGTFDICLNCDCGLWLRCSGDGTILTTKLENCVWFFADNFKIEQNQPSTFRLFFFALFSFMSQNNCFALLITFITLTLELAYFDMIFNLTCFTFS